MKNTTIHNPILWADVPDPDVIRVGEDYYMISTSMHSMPGCPIMRSKDLAHWEIIHYVFDTLEDNDAHNLQDYQGIYGKGSWAASLRAHAGAYYACFSSNDSNSFYVYKTDDIDKGGWNRWSVIPKLLHDPALLFDGDTPYVIYGNGEINIIELEADLSGIKEDGLNQELFSTPKEGRMLRCEGCHAYRINGIYYLIFIEWTNVGNCRRRQVCYRSKSLLGPYEHQVIFDDDMGYHNAGIAQGCLMDSSEGIWYAMLFQDHGAVGRIPFVLPVAWENAWPVIGENGKAPENFNISYETVPVEPIVMSDEFQYSDNKLALQWQWNHRPDDKLWSLTERPGWLRLTTGWFTTKGILYARNTLTQRTLGPSCTATTRLDLVGMKSGDCAGLLALQSTFGFIGVRRDHEGSKKVVMCTKRGDYEENLEASVSYSKNDIYLKICFKFEDNIDLATFYYSEDDKEWLQLGSDLKMKYLLDHFMGYRIGLFNYATSELGGFADFDYFHIEVAQ